MLDLEAAQERILSRISPLDDQLIPLSAATGRFLAASVVAPIDLPLFDNSAMDGYAVRSEDVTGASEERPVALRVIGKIAAGARVPGDVLPGTCIRLFTGSPLPGGADAVVMQEDTRAAEQGSQIDVLANARPWENVRLRGEDVKTGATLVQAGDRITSANVALLAAIGLGSVEVRRQPLIGLIATGSELREPGERLETGQIYESNRVALGSLAQAAGARIKTFPIVPDTLVETERMLDSALAECDSIITAGGVSVGEFDFVKTAIDRLGGQLDFWRVAIKPGKPFVFGSFRGKLLFGVPGNPVSAFVTFLLLVRPTLLRLQGALQTALQSIPGILGEQVVNEGDRRHFIRVRVDEVGVVRPSGAQASHMMSSLGHANGLIDVPPKSILPAGKPVRVLQW